MDEFARLDATAQAELIRRDAIKPIELVDATIARIERLNPIINAVITPLFEKARAAALSPDLPGGPFKGVPLLLKDYLCETAGDPYYEGMKFLRDLGWRSKHDSYLAARFRAAGFIVMGKTNLPELAGGGLTEPEAFGPTRNPWNVERSADGSSGGSAAAVASGMVAVAHGNDGTGSIRGPASACALVGFKPSRGRLPTGPGWHGGIFGNVSEFVLTRSVRDAAAILDAVQGAHPGNLFVAPPPIRPYREEQREQTERLRIGIMVHDPIMQLAVHPECVKAAEQTGHLLESLGHYVVYAYPPQLDSGETGLGLAPRIISTTGLAHKLDTWSQRTGRTIGPEDVEAGTWAAAQQGREFDAVLMQAAIERLTNGICRVVEWWSTGFDLLLTPVRTQPPMLLGVTDHEALLAGMGFFTMPYSLSGQPAVSLPMHWTDDGLPVGVQLVADYAREDMLFCVAAQLEQAQPWADRHPPVFAEE